ncbi:S-layer homology domain-containing protein [Bacillus sp. FJAT-45350]|uniref:S-layer homology domain-containing protein n=1 Tax=Bacillus sp. FJAT-45350 TaxID=2011014 RepID=UPI000BB8FF87|nr:S-layer homology domain-containing protein [Bacillus sp. FJAT-45350]
MKNKKGFTWFLIVIMLVSMFQISMMPGSVLAEGMENVPEAGVQLSPSAQPLLSNDANLSSLTVSAGELSSEFDANTTTYDVINLNTSQLTITAIPAEPNASVTINGAPTTSDTISLQAGNNSIPVVVTAQNGTASKTYTVNANLNSTFILVYSAPENGTIEGETSQAVNQGGNGTEVTAVPNENYRFIRWSDGITDNPRTDTDVNEDVNVTAEFQTWVTTTFVLNSGDAEIDTMSLSNSTLGRSNTNASTLSSGDNEFRYITQEFIPSVSGIYHFGNSQASIDTVMLVYEGEFDPEQPANNFVGFNDDNHNPSPEFQSGDVPEDAFCAPETETNTDRARDRCPAVELELTADTRYIIVTSTFSSSASSTLDFPLTFFVSGPAAVSSGDKPVNHIVTFEVSGGSTVADQTVAHGEKVSKPADPTKANHTFEGWFTDNTHTTAFDFDTTVTGDTAIYAKWTMNQSSGGSSGGGGGTTAPTTEQITVPVETGLVNEGIVVNETPITRTRETDGRVRDQVSFTSERVRETIEAVREAEQNTARIVIPDANDEVSEIEFSVPNEAMRDLGDSDVNLEISTENVRITIPESSLDDFDEDLYFRLVPVKGVDQRQEVENRARVEQIVQEVTRDRDVNVVARPMTIETNMQNRPVTLVLPLRDVELPTNEQERTRFLNNLVIFAEHSDGERKLIRANVVDYKQDQLGLEFGVNKFSTFTILHLEGWEELIDDSMERGYIKGFEDETFRPNHSITRAEMAMMFARNLGFVDSQTATEKPFPDVATSHWAAGSIEFVKNVGLMRGDLEGQFHPNAPMKRAEIATVVARYLELELGTVNDSVNAFQDITGHWAVREIAAVKEADIVSGYNDGTFRPNGNVTRAESVVILNNAFDISPYSVEIPTFPDVTLNHWAYEEVEKAVIRK